jgi:pyruvate/2-oxoglutarate/acetoin dehydrogenase E1 component
MLELGKDDLVDFQVERFGNTYPTFSLRPTHDALLTIACYGYNFELVRAAALKLLMENEIFSEIVLFSQLSPFELKPIFDSLERTRKLVTVEEGSLSLGWGAEVAAQSAERMDGFRIRRVAALDLPVANSKSLEEKILPSVEEIVRIALAFIG